jgi:hypothetical protein
MQRHERHAISEQTGMIDSALKGQGIQEEVNIGTKGVSEFLEASKGFRSILQEFLKTMHGDGLINQLNDLLSTPTFIPGGSGLILFNRRG